MPRTSVRGNLRGFTNLMMDFATGEPSLTKLIDMLFEYEKKLVSKWLSVGMDIMAFHTDIGTQNGLMISPPHFRKYLKPMFKELFTMCRKVGVPVYLSTDGRVVEIVDDFIECGVSMQDPQFGAISMQEIKKYYKGKMCLYFNLDMQKLPFISLKEAKEMVKDAVDNLNLPNGGLTLRLGIYDDIVPIENVDAICQGFMQYCFGIK